MNWLSTNDLLAIHSDVIRETGGAPGIVNPGALESAVKRPFTAFDQTELFLTLFEKVAALLHALVTFHPFVDGNKQVGLVAADIILRLNNRRIRPGSHVQEFFWSIARGEQSVEKIAAGSN